MSFFCHILDQNRLLYVSLTQGRAKAGACEEGGEPRWQHRKFS